MNIQRIYTVALVATMASGLISCDKQFLDTRRDTSQTEQTLNSNYATLTSLANAPYNYLRNEFTIMDNNLFAAVSDEAVQTSASSQVRFFNNGTWNASANPDGFYSAFYLGIRAANYFIEQSPDYRAFLALNRDTVSPSGKINYTNDTLN